MINEELAKFKGMSGTPVIMEIEKGAIRRYAEAIDDPNPQYSDEEFAKNSRHGEITCPPGFFGWPVGKGPFLSGPITIAGTMLKFMDALNKAGFGTLLDGGIEYEFIQPIRAGDRLELIPKITELYERETKMGTTVFGIIEATYTNQNGDIVVKTRNTLICS